MLLNNVENIAEEFRCEAFQNTAGVRIEAECIPQSRIFGELALGKLAEDPRKIVFSDEAHSWLIGYINKQNCRFWSEDQPEELQKLPRHPEKLTVWCGLWAAGIFGPYFFKDAANHNVTVNGEMIFLASLIPTGT